ncbi:MAG: DUF58 domain-containing protein [Candidatus Taylorbacteria bacterium]
MKSERFENASSKPLPDEEQNEIPYDVAKGSDFNLLKKNVANTKTLDGLNGLNEIEIAKKSHEFKRIASSALHTAREIKRCEKKMKREKDPRAPILGNTADLLLHIWENGASLAEFSDKLTKGAEGGEPRFSERERGFYRLALIQIQTELNELFHKIEEIPIESGFNPENLRRWLKKTIGSLATVGILGVALSGDARHEQNIWEVAKTHQSKAKNEKIVKNNSYQLVNPLRNGDIYKPHIGGEENGEPGEFLPMEPIARIHERFGSAIKDPLWMTEITMRTLNGEFHVMESEANETSPRIHADVILKPISVAKDLEVVLPAPLGFIVGEVKTKPYVPFSLNKNNSIITFQGDVQDVGIQYTVIEGKRDFPETIYPNPDTLRTEDANRVIKNLSNSTYDNVPAVLDKYLEDFTYIASNELETLLSRLPGTIEEKIGALKIGSCDTLSAYTAGLLNDANKRAFVGGGYLQNDDFIDSSRPHAKLILFTGNGSTPAMYETTAAPRKNFINLKFGAEDRKALEEIIATSEPGRDPATRSKIYESFKEKLNQILSTDAYSKFKNKEKSPEGKISISELYNKLEEKIDSLPSIRRIASIAGVEIALIAALITAGILGAKGIKNIKRKVSIKLREGTNEETVKAFQSLSRDSTEREDNADPEEDKAVQSRLDILYQKQPELQSLFPLEEVKQLTLNEKRDYCKLLLVARMFVKEPWGMFDMISSVVNQRELGREIERLKADGISVDKWMNRVRENFTDEKRKERMKKYIPENVKGIMDVGTKIAVEKLEKTNGVNSTMLFKILGIGPADESQEKGKPKPIAETGFEFHEYFPYSEGMDARSIDWNVYARSDQLVVKRFSEARLDKKVPAIDVVIDVTEHDTDELSGFVAMLLYTRKYKRLDIQSITLTSYDQVVLRLNKTVVTKLIEEGRQSIEYLITKIKTLKWEHSLEMFKGNLLNNSRELREPLLRLPPRNLGLDKNATVLGIGELGGFRFAKHSKRIDSFLVFKKTEEEKNKNLSV